jgi:sec-independent protein translocase protein TatB
MFGLSWAQLGIIVLVGAFVLGPERIPTAVTFVTGSLRKVRTMAAGAQAGLRSEIGPELDQPRRQVADLQSLKEVQELRDLRNLHPKNFIGKSLLGPELSGGVSGFLGFGGAPSTAAQDLAQQAAAVRPTAAEMQPEPVAVGAAEQPIPEAARSGVLLTKSAPIGVAGERPPYDADGT